MSHGSVAAKVRAYKEQHPHLYCSARGCLWRIRDVNGNTISICRNHGMHERPDRVNDLTAQNDTTDSIGSGAVVSESMSQS